MMDAQAKQTLAGPLGQLPSGCFILTARDGERSTGILASWVQQASFEPPAVTVAVKRGRPIEALIEASGHFVLNTVGEQAGPMFKHFAKGFDLEQPAFEGLDAQTMPAGVVIGSCVAHLACRVMTQVDAGDHRIYVGQVIHAATQGAGKPYVHIRNNGFSY